MNRCVIPPPHSWKLELFLIFALVVAFTVGCSSGGDDQQQQADQQAEPQAQQQVEPAAAQVQMQEQQAQPQAAEPMQQQQAAPAAADSADESQQDAPAQQAADSADSTEEDGSEQADSMGGMDDGMAVAIIEEAPYDTLSPRLQLLRDSGYPVYVSPDGYTIALGTPDLSPGRHRVSVVIEGPPGLVEFPALSVTALPQSAPAELQEVIARFARFPDGVRGFHVTTVDFTRAGRWNLILHIPSEDGFTPVGLALDIPDDTAAPSVGDPAPPSHSRTLIDVANIADLSTGETPDPGLYLVSLADAVAADKPFVVVFASPGFCTNAFCGPQAEVLSEVRSMYGDAANYVHVDLYENPVEVRLGADPIETPILEEWGLHTDEWTFVVNADGIVTARFEAFAPFAEVEAALGELLEGSEG